MSILEHLGGWLARYLSQPRKKGAHAATCHPSILSATLKKGDVLLIEGNSRFSEAVKHLTQSTWSHAAFFVGDVLGTPKHGGDPHVLVEADIDAGVRAVPLSMYSHLHTRICRPVGLLKEEIDTLVTYMVSRIGYQYDLKNIIDLARYLIQNPPVPRQWRRRLLALGSGDPTRAICSSLIAQAFQSIRYPILPEIVPEKQGDPSQNSNGAVFYNRHHSLFTPRDFDVSPYFRVIKPTIEHHFDPHQLIWGNDEKRYEQIPI